MKIFDWDDDKAPDFTQLEDGGLKFYSHPDMYLYKLGDQIHYKTRIGTTAFEVIDVRLAHMPDYDPDLQVITTKRL